MARKREPAKTYKMPKGFVSGKKRTKGEPIMYDERKQKMNLGLTPTAINIAKKLAATEGISCSEVVERLLREKGSSCLLKTVLSPVYGV